MSSSLSSGVSRRRTEPERFPLALVAAGKRER
jgi:hypothetical protein